MRSVTREERSHRLRQYVCAALTSACVWACGDEQTPGQHDLFDPGSVSIDASVRLDASDGSTTDASEELDATLDETVENTCRVRSEAVIAQRFFDPQSPLAVAVHGQGALLGWSQYRGGKSRVLARWLGVEQGAAEAAGSDDDANQTELHSSATTTGFLTTWSDDRGGLRARRTSDQGVVLDSTPITIAASGAGSVSAQGADGNMLVVFVGPARTQLLGTDARPVGVAHELPGFGAVIGRPALAAFRDGYLLAWVDAATRGVQLQQLDQAGLAVGASQRVDSDGDAQGHLDLATTSVGGALAWDMLVDGARAEVRLRALGMDAKPTGNEQTLTPFPESGLQPALVAARGGYLVAYRSAQGATLALRLAMLDGRGKPIARGVMTVTGLEQQALPLAMRMTDDGRQLFLGWLDLTPNTPDYQLQQAWMECD
ncbi:MAG: hypothetical protein ABW352_06115 [Polyangiales bacterium]